MRSVNTRRHDPAGSTPSPTGIDSRSYPSAVTALAYTAFPDDHVAAPVMEPAAMRPAGISHADSATSVRGMPADRLPWALDAGWGSIGENGHLLARVRGLVLARHELVPASLRGTNPFPWLTIVVTCLTVRPDRTADFLSIRTGDFAVSRSGNADIDARVSLPQPCLAPIVLITSPPGASQRWLAATQL
jgi:hypothetical protein